MMKALIDRVPTSTKVQLGLKCLGLTADEKAAVDLAIGSVAGTPVGATILGTSITSIEGLIAKGIELAQKDLATPMEQIKPFAKLLSSDQVRHTIAQVIDMSIRNQPDPSLLYSAISKVATVPGLPWSARDFNDVPSFIADGLLPAARELIGSAPDPEPQDVVSAIVRCPFCRRIHGVSHEHDT